MCVIIHKNPGVTLPVEKIEIACDINKHGFGIAWPNKGRLQYIRSIIEPNDPKVVCDHLQKLKDKQVFLHLRHATVGKVTMDNNHPFVILSHKRHGMDLAWMHNGTLWDWKPQNEKDSDTLLFHQQLMIPLALRVNAFSKKAVLDDSLFKRVLTKEVGYTQSVFVVFDGAGNSWIANKDKGTQFDGWWASNDYSFKTTHIRSSAYTAPSGGYSNGAFDPWSGYGADPWEDADTTPQVNEMFTTWEDDLREHDLAEQAANAARNSKPSHEGTLVPKELLRPGYVDEEKRVSWGAEKVKEKVYHNTLKTGANLMSTGLENKDLMIYKKTFLELSGLNSLDALERLTEQDLCDCIQQYPHAMGRLIVDFMQERRQLAQQIARQASIIKGNTV